MEIPQTPEKTNSEQETSLEVLQQRAIYKITTLLEVAEEAVEKKYTIASYPVEDLLAEIEKIDSDEIDLSSIENFDARIEQLKAMAPLIEIESCIEKAQSFMGKDDKLPLASWYWEAKNKFDDFFDQMDEADHEKIQGELEEIKKELGIE